MAYIFRINGRAYRMENPTISWRPAGRLRRWHKFVKGWVQGKLITLCLHVATMVEVVKNVARSTLAKFARVEQRITEQRILMDAALLGG